MSEEGTLTPGAQRRPWGSWASDSIGFTGPELLQSGRSPESTWSVFRSRRSGELEATASIL